LEGYLAKGNVILWKPEGGLGRDNGGLMSLDTASNHIQNKKER